MSTVSACTFVGPRVLQYAAVLREGAVKCCVRVYVVADIGAQVSASCITLGVAAIFTSFYVLNFECECANTHNAQCQPLSVPTC